MPIAGGPGPDPWDQPPDDTPRVPRFFMQPHAREAAELAARFEAIERTNAALAARVAELERQVKDLRQPPRADGADGLIPALSGAGKTGKA